MNVQLEIEVNWLNVLGHSTIIQMNSYTILFSYSNVSKQCDWYQNSSKEAITSCLHFAACCMHLNLLVISWQM